MRWIVVFVAVAVLSVTQCNASTSKYEKRLLKKIIDIISRRDGDSGSDSGSGGPDSGSGGPDSGSGGPDSGSGGPDSGSGGPDSGMGGPDSGLGGPDSGMGGPDSGMGGPDSGLGGPDSGMGGPDSGLGGPESGSGGPDSGLGGPDSGSGGFSGPDSGSGGSDSGSGSGSTGGEDKITVNKLWYLTAEWTQIDASCDAWGRFLGQQWINPRTSGVLSRVCPALEVATKAFLSASVEQKKAMAKVFKEKTDLMILAAKCTNLFVLYESVFGYKLFSCQTPLPTTAVELTTYALVRGCLHTFGSAKKTEEDATGSGSGSGQSGSGSGPSGDGSSGSGNGPSGDGSSGSGNGPSGDGSSGSGNGPSGDGSSGGSSGPSGDGSSGGSSGPSGDGSSGGSSGPSGDGTPEQNGPSGSGSGSDDGSGAIKREVLDKMVDLLQIQATASSRHFAIFKENANRNAKHRYLGGTSNELRISDCL